MSLILVNTISIERDLLSVINVDQMEEHYSHIKKLRVQFLLTFF